MTTTIGLWVRWNRSAKKHKVHGAGHRHSSCEKYTASHFIGGRALGAKLGRIADVSAISQKSMTQGAEACPTRQNLSYE